MTKRNFPPVPKPGEVPATKTVKPTPTKPGASHYLDALDKALGAAHAAGFLSFGGHTRVTNILADEFEKFINV